MILQEILMSMGRSFRGFFLMIYQPVVWKKKDIVVLED